MLAQQTLYSDLEAMLGLQSVTGPMPTESRAASGPMFENLCSPFPYSTRRQYNNGMPSQFVDMQQAPSFMEFPHPLVGHGQSGEGLYALPSSAFSLDLPLQFQALVYPQGHPNASQLSLVPGSTESDPTNDLFLPGSSRGPSDSSSSTALSLTSDLHPVHPSPDQQTSCPDNTAVRVVMKQEEENIHLTTPVKKSRILRVRSDPQTSTGKYKCRHHGCLWRFRSTQMCQRHERTHNAMNEYFCCNPDCSTNDSLKKNKAGFSRRDSLRRHYTQKSSDDPCVVMAKSLGWTGLSNHEEEMFRVTPDLGPYSPPWI